MNKYTKLGVTALTGAIASYSVAANAGALDVSGSVVMTYTTNSTTSLPSTCGTASTSGCGTDDGNLGLSSNYTFSGSGEMDNGMAWSYATALDGAGNFTSTAVTINMNEMGTIKFDRTGGSPVEDIDDKTPSAFEEVWDGGASNRVSGIGTSTHIDYKLPALPGNTSIELSWTPEMGHSAEDQGVTKGSSTAGGGGGSEIVIITSPIEGLTIGAGAASIDMDASLATSTDDKEEYVGFITYKTGAFTLGYTESYEDHHTAVTAETGALKHYENRGYAVSFQVNDNLSVSYGDYESEKDQSNSTGVQTLDASGFNVSYNLGGATLKIHHGEVKNPYYVESADKVEQTIVQLGLAF